MLGVVEVVVPDVTEVEALAVLVPASNTPETTPVTPRLIVPAIAVTTKATRFPVDRIPMSLSVPFRCRLSTIASVS